MSVSRADRVGGGKQDPLCSHTAAGILLQGWGQPRPQAIPWTFFDAVAYGNMGTAGTDMAKHHSLGYPTIAGCWWLYVDLVPLWVFS